MSKIVVIGDCHFPFTDFQALQKIIQFIAKVKPDYVVQIGDLYDLYAQSSFPKSLKLPPAQEMEQARNCAKQMWEEIHQASKKSIKWQLLGNHCIRPFKRIMEAYPEGEVFFNVMDFFKFENVRTMPDARTHLQIDNVLFHHGYSSKLGAHRDHTLMNTVVGHTHTGGVVFRSHEQDGMQKTIWELNAGFVGNTKEPCFSYTPMRITKWTIGFGYIDDQGPRFIPL